MKSKIGQMALFQLLSLSFILLLFNGCRHVNTNNPAVVKAVTLLDAENTVNTIAHGLLEASGTIESLKATEPGYYANVKPKLQQLARLNDLANSAVLAAKNGDNADWRGAITAVAKSVGDPVSLTQFGFKNPNSQKLVQLGFATLVTGINLSAAFGGVQ